ncbi:MAG: AraC family transcriptional regulator [Gammaproteobacteria bacterium]|nr:AraC family transcriptional regulator [Gammaproteobacteria bacterium]
MIMPGTPQLPFASQPLLITQDYDKAISQLNGALTEERTVSPRGRGQGADVQLTLHALPAVKLFGGHWGDAVNIHSAPLASWHGILPLTGGISCRQGGTEATAGELLLFAPGHEIDVTWEAHTRAVVIAVDNVTLRRYLQDQHHADLPPVSQRTLHVRREHPALSSLGHLLQLTDAELRAGSHLLDSAAGQQHLQSLFCESLLQLVPGFADQQQRPILPGLLKRTLDYIQANLGQPLSMEELVTVSGASRRSLEQAFRHNLQTSPMRYVLQCRLQAAREALRNSHPGELQLTDLAFRLGFSQASHFTHAYKRAFGELPSQTLAH